MFIYTWGCLLLVIGKCLIVSAADYDLGVKESYNLHQMVESLHAYLLMRTALTPQAPNPAKVRHFHTFQDFAR